MECLTMYEQWIADIRHADPAVRYEAAQKLGASNDQRAADPLIGLLVDANAKVQYAAFSGLIKLRAAEAAASMIDMLVGDFNSRVWDLLKLNIGLRLRMGLLDLVQTGDQTIAARVSAALDGATMDEAQRAYLIRLLGKTGATAHVAMLIDLLDDQSEAMQTASAEALGWMRDQRAVEPLIGLLGDYRDTVREVAAEALGRIGDSAAVEVMLDMLNDANEWVRRAAVVALGELGDRRAVEPLSAALQDDSTVVQDAAFESLKKFSYGSYNTIL
jgi:HEAT repeat protein